METLQLTQVPEAKDELVDQAISSPEYHERPVQVPNSGLNVQEQPCWLHNTRFAPWPMTT